MLMAYCLDEQFMIYLPDGNFPVCQQIKCMHVCSFIHTRRSLLFRVKTSLTATKYSLFQHAYLSTNNFALSAWI
jgi:hypothetical protein